MGSQLSSHQSDHLKDDDSDTAPADRLYGRKRKRGDTSITPGSVSKEVDQKERMDEASDPSSSLTEPISEDSSSPRKSKRRRLLVQSLFQPFSRMSEVINERSARWFSKYLFLSFLEMATERANRPDFSSDPDVRNAILTMLDSFQKEDIEILRRGWRALSIVVGCPMRPGQLPAREDNLEEDAAIVAMVMKQCSDNDTIQLLGCRALRVLICDGDSSRKASESGEKTWRILHRAGVLSALTNAIRSCADERSLQGLCLSFVAMLIKEVGDPVKQELLDNGGVEILVQTCRNWTGDAAVFHTVLCVIYQLTTRTTRQSLIDQGIIPLLSSCIVLHSEHKTIVELTLGTMNQLSMVSETIFTGNRLVSKMLLVMDKYPDNETVQFFGMVLLRAVGRTEPIPFQHCASRVVATLKRFPDTSGILFFSFALILQLLQIHNSDHNDALALLSSMGALELVTDAVHRHKEVYGLGPVAHLILMHAWEHRPTDRVNAAATQAFGGSEDVISLISGLDEGDMLDNNNNNNGVGNDD